MKFSQSLNLIAMRSICDGDLGFLRRLYASTRSAEMARVPWSELQKEQFLAMQFRLQHHHYQTYSPPASFDIILINDQPAGRLYVNRSELSERYD